MINSSEGSLLVEVEGNNYSKKEKDIHWEYVKDKLFEGKINRSNETAKKFSGPILFTLKNATKKDSLAVSEIIESLKKVIPNKTIESFSSFTKNNFSEYTKDKTNRNTKVQGYSYSDIISSTIKINFETDKYRNKHGSNEHVKSLYFSFKEDTNLEDRKKYIQYEILRTICFIQDNNDILFLNITYPTEAIFNSPTYNILDKEFTEIDKFLVQKLYADNFKQQFSNYMYKTYPWRYANLFINKNLAHLKVYTLIGFLGLLMFVLAFGLFNTRKTTYLHYFFPMLVILLGLMNLHWIYSYIIDIEQPNNSSLNKSIYSFLYVLSSALIISFLLWIIEQKIINNYLGFTYQFVMKLVLTFSVLHIPVLIGYFLIGKTNETLPVYIPLFFIFLTLTLGRGLLMYLNHFSDSLVKQKEIELRKLKELNTQNELKSLHAHINPHFLYNALNSIASLMHESTSKAEDMILSLSDLFRYSINRKGKKMSTIEDEVEMVENYLKIEKIRFEKRLQFTIDVEKGLLEKEIPMYLLQPLIENAVKHGVSKVEAPGVINLEIKQGKNSLHITVSDNGDDFPEDMYSGYGLQSVYDLLRLCYGDKAFLNWTNTPKKSITILIPSQL
ncbi:sensor histidine kinase [Thalassobellus suaedae]|uniref:Histidine kinase n=1 Tax=Thalassobellus suaedae TaxID=3074124 RepID=A0ABY9Y7J5_9FLAO|nr:histidine kinase [Flavobacteriaceae bacterium HL-DH10]